ncbi:hypothetical protein L798_00619 [Zootermopsis nevadensis]|uniref:Uncharacterized protein n=1 Tax=Zootermopsis nevadensis TaxID=136037 RepID=A0A067RQ88_ZOONE|nr:hypothetical protein L798_00619 [Zootermopsis nevadensis]
MELKSDNYKHSRQSSFTANARSHFLIFIPKTSYATVHYKYFHRSVMLPPCAEAYHRQERCKWSNLLVYLSDGGSTSKFVTNTRLQSTARLSTESKDANDKDK